MLKEELMKARIRVAQEVLEGKRDSMLRCEAESKVSESYYFVIEFGFRHSLPIESVWPDGDGPKSPSAQDVIDVIDGYSHSIMSTIEEWDLARGSVLSVTRSNSPIDSAELVI